MAVDEGGVKIMEDVTIDAYDRVENTSNTSML